MVVFWYNGYDIIFIEGIFADILFILSFFGRKRKIRAKILTILVIFLYFYIFKKCLKIHILQNLIWRTPNDPKGEGMPGKKYLIILILKILETNTDREHPLTQIKIAEQVSEVYPCDRKTVGRNIAFLREIGYPIVKTAYGFYMSGKHFSVEETQFIMRAVREATGKPEEEKEQLLSRLEKLLCKIYRRRK